MEDTSGNAVTDLRISQLWQIMQTVEEHWEKKVHMKVSVGIKAALREGISLTD